MARTRCFRSSLPTRQHCSHCFFSSKRRSRMQNVNKRRQGTCGRKSKYCGTLLFMFLLNLDFKAGHRGAYLQAATLRTSHRCSNSSFRLWRRGMCHNPDWPSLDLERIRRNLTRASARLNSRMAIFCAEGGGATDKKPRYNFDWDNMLMEVSGPSKPFGGKGMHIDLRSLME